MRSLHTDARRPASRSSPSGPERRAGAPRAAVLVALLCLSLATGAALVGAGAALADPPIRMAAAGPAAAHEDVAHDFYRAINDAIRTRDVDALDQLVAPAVAWCAPCDDEGASRDGLKRYLTRLHRAAPAARIETETVVAGYPDTVMARVRVAGLSLIGDAAAWGPVETLRIDRGLVVERRTGPDGLSLIEPMLAAQLDALPPAVTGVAMARLTFGYGAAVDGLLSAGPTLLVVESGTLTMRIARGGRILRPGGGEETVTPASDGGGLVAVLRQGDGAIVPAGTRHSLRQEGSVPADVLGVTLFFVDTGRGQRGPELTAFFPVDGSDRELPHRHPPPSVRFLAEGTVTAWPRGPVAVAIGRAVLEAGAVLVPAEGETVLLAVETGLVDATGEAERTVAAGDDMLQPVGADREFRNPGDSLAVLLVLTVAPAAG
jgi:hypothetical protein